MLIHAKTSDAPPSIELTPIIDMVFLLLIFFLVATTFQQTEREMQIALPETETGGPISMALREIVVNVQSDGAIVVSGQTMDVEQFRSLVAQAVERNSDQKVTVRGDRSTAYESIVRVLDVCKASGIQEPFLDTVPLR